MKIDRECLIWLVSPKQMAEIIQMYGEGTVSRKGAREVMTYIYERNLTRCRNAGIKFVN